MNLRFRIVALGGLVAGGGLAQVALPSMPTWVTTYPGVEAKATTRPGISESSYAANAAILQVLDHLRMQFEAAGLEFNAVDNGIGTTVRAAAPECDLLVNVRERTGDKGPVTAVTISCTPPVSGVPAGGAASVAVTNGPQNARPFSARPNTAMNRRIEAPARPVDSGMRRYDQPVAYKTESYYADDAPQLVWPSWLVKHDATPVDPPQETVDQYKDRMLRSSYQTKAPMSELYDFYRALVAANGFTVINAKLSTGSTINQVMQNASGTVQGVRRTSSDSLGPSTNVSIGFSRSVLNGPITVSLTVRVKGTFKR